MERTRFRGSQDVIGGCLFIALSAFALWAMKDLPAGREYYFGPGTMPRIAAAALALTGAYIAVRGWRTASFPRAHPSLRSMCFIIGAIVCFACALRPLGLIVASFLSVMIAAAAAPAWRWKETSVVAAVAALLCGVGFGIALEIPVALWPHW